MNCGYNVKGTGWIPGKAQDLGLAPRRLGAPYQGDILWMSESQVRVPSDMIALGDAADTFEGGMVIERFLAPDGYPWPVRGDSSLTVNSYLGDVHKGGANIAFCDGHVEYSKTPQWVEATEAARKRWNNDNQPHQETWGTTL